MDFQSFREKLPSEKYLLAASALVLPLYDFILATLLGRQLVFRIGHPVAVFLSLAASTGFFIFLKDVLDRDLRVSTAAAIFTGITLPIILVQQPIGFGERPLIYMAPTGLGILAAFFESGLKRKWSDLEIGDWKKDRAVQLGFFHAALALEMYIINRGINFAEMASRLRDNGTFLTVIFTVVRPLAMLPLNFFIAAAPIYLYREKKLKTPLIAFMTWFSAGIIQFFLKWDIYPVDVFHGGIRLLPPQPDYLLRPWIPLTLIIVAWKLEKKYKEGKSKD